MRNADSDIDLSEFTTEPAAPADAAHETWIEKQIQEALDAKRSGTATYRSLKEVAAKYGLDES